MPLSVASQLPSVLSPVSLQERQLAEGRNSSVSFPDILRPWEQHRRSEVRGKWC